MEKVILTQEQIDEIIEMYKSGKSLRRIEKETKISKSILSKRLKEAGIKIERCRPHKYTQEDIEFLKEYYPCGAWDKLFEHFKGCSRSTIQGLASKYKIRSESFWSEEDIQILKDNMYKLPWRRIKPLLKSDRTIFSIQTKAFKLGYTSSCWWTDEEIEFLKNNYTKKTLDELCNDLPNHPRGSIATQAYKMGLKTKERVIWSDEEIEFL